MAFNEPRFVMRATNGLAKYTFKVAGSTESVELTSMNETELSLRNYTPPSEVPSDYFNPKDFGNTFGMDFIVSKLYEDIFGKSFYTKGGASVGLLTDIGEQSLYRNVKLNAEYRPAKYFEEGE